MSHFRPGKDFTRISILNTLLVLGALLVYYPWRFLRSLTRERVRRFIADNITRSKDSHPRLAASIGLGVIFGMYPAVMASGLQPVVGLRAEWGAAPCICGQLTGREGSNGREGITRNTK